jgi:CheY-like chemotaxis protein
MGARRSTGWRCIRTRSTFVLMDVQMPVLDGYEATRLLRQSPVFADLPIVALTAGAFKSQQDEAREAGMNAFVAKPFNVDELMDVVRRLARVTPMRLYAATAAAAVAASPAQPAQPASLPGIDLARALAVWKERAPYSAILGRFAADFGDIADRMEAQLVASGPSAIDPLCHQLKGVAGNLALPEVARLAEELQKAVANGGNAAGLIAALRGALETVFASIDELASQVGRQAAATSVPAMAAQDAAAAALNAQTTTELLSALLACLDQDNPDVATTLLVTLAPRLPAGAIDAVRARLDDFDFRAAEVEVRTLIATYHSNTGGAR